MNSSVMDILKKAEEILETAKFGHQDLKSKDRSRRYSGIRNLVVFGRSVTFVIQNLKTPVGQEKFNKWYQPMQEKMKDDIVMKYFVTLRNEILKQGKLPISTSANIKNFSTSDIPNLGPRPPGADRFFIGDQTGGSGWEFELPDGTREKYYIEIPESIAIVKQHFSELPVPEDDKLKEKSIEELCEYYINKLEWILNEARKEFLHESTQTIKGKRLPPYLRVIK